MRQFLYGMFVGAVAMYVYWFHGHQIQFVADYFASWRKWAVEETSKYK